MIECHAAAAALRAQYYEGNFENNRRHGKGTHVARGVTYTGYWAFGLVSGFGDLKLADGYTRHDDDWPPQTFVAAVKRTRALRADEELAHHNRHMGLLAGVIEIRKREEEVRIRAIMEVERAARLKATQDAAVARGMRRRAARNRRLKGLDLD